MPELSTSIWSPDKPHVFRADSKRHPNKSAETLMFADYLFLKRELDRIRAKSRPNSVPSELHRHLEWLLARGEDRICERPCPFCKSRHIAHFLARLLAEGGMLLSLAETSCSECLSELRLRASGQSAYVLSTRFSSLRFGVYGASYAELSSFFRILYFAPHRLTTEWAFEFFSRQP
jgi:hypothetical protein